MNSRLIRSIVLMAGSLGLIWTLFMPIWQFPDEQAHFAQVQNYAEIGNDPVGVKDLSAELYLSQEKLGTLRDQSGNNQFTSKPTFNLAYSETKEGFHEKIINNQPIKTRVTYLKQESPRYPPLYYFLSSFAYRVVYNQDLFTRIYFVRFLSVLIFASFVYTTFLLNRSIFKDNEELQIASTLAASLHPMSMFVGVGINNDVLVNLLSTSLLLVLLKLINEKIKLQNLIILLFIVIFGLITKQTSYLLLPNVIIALFFAFVIAKPKTKFVLLTFILLSSALSFIFYQILARFNQGFWMPYWPTLNLSQVLNHPDLVNQVLALMKRLYQETFAWYWGVYRWLSLTMPINTYRLIKIVIILSLLGRLGSTGHQLQQIKRGVKSLKSININLLFLVLANLIYFVILFSWELSAILINGFGRGIQGRYFFPLMSSQMSLLVYGWWLICPRSLRRDLPIFVLIAFLSLNLYSFWHVITSYYSPDSINLFFTQLSQYKPWFAKWPYLLLPLFILTASLVNLIYRLIQLELFLSKTHEVK